MTAAQPVSHPTLGIVVCPTKEIQHISSGKSGLAIKVLDKADYGGTNVQPAQGKNSHKRALFSQLHREEQVGRSTEDVALGPSAITRRYPDQ